MAWTGWPGGRAALARHSTESYTSASIPGLSARPKRRARRGSVVTASLLDFAYQLRRPPAIRLEGMNPANGICCQVVVRMDAPSLEQNLDHRDLVPRSSAVLLARWPCLRRIAMIRTNRTPANAIGWRVHFPYLSREVAIAFAETPQRIRRHMRTEACCDVSYLGWHLII